MCGVKSEILMHSLQAGFGIIPDCTETDKTKKPDLLDRAFSFEQLLFNGDDGTGGLSWILLLIPPFAIIDNPLFNGFVEIAEGHHARYYLTPQSMKAIRASN